MAAAATGGEAVEAQFMRVDQQQPSAGPRVWNAEY
jgi:hypothetical protein